MTRKLVRTYINSEKTISYDFVVKFYMRNIKQRGYAIKPKKEMFEFLNTFSAWEVIKDL